jgi:hypothetical protein
MVPSDAGLILGAAPGSYQLASRTATPGAESEMEETQRPKADKHRCRHAYNHVGIWSERLSRDPQAPECVYHIDRS